MHSSGYVLAYGPMAFQECFERIRGGPPHAAGVGCAMATYQIWADITQLASGRYFVTVSAVPEHERTMDRTGGVTTAEAATLDEAKTISEDLVLALGKKLRARGHVIVDRFDDAPTLQ